MSWDIIQIGVVVIVVQLEWYGYSGIVVIVVQLYIGVVIIVVQLWCSQSDTFIVVQLLQWCSCYRSVVRVVIIILLLLHSHLVEIQAKQLETLTHIDQCRLTRLIYTCIQCERDRVSDSEIENVCERESVTESVRVTERERLRVRE